MDINPKIASIWTIVAGVLAIVGGLVLYFTFLSKKNNEKFKGFLGWLYDFLTFKKLVLENVLKVLYLMLTIFVTLISFVFSNFLMVLLTLVLGNLAVRIVYEFALVLLLICRNTTEINSAMTRSERKAEEKLDEEVATEK